MRKSVMLSIAVLVSLISVAGFVSEAAAADYLSPCAMAAARDGKTIYIAESDARQVAVFDVASLKVVKTVPVKWNPTGLAVSADGTRLIVTCASPYGKVCIVDAKAAKVSKTIPVGHGTCGPALSPDGRLAYVCNRFNNEVAVLDVNEAKVLALVPVGREPISAAVTPDGKLLLVANHLSKGPGDVNYVGSNVSIMDTATRKVVATVKLPSGSVGLRGICVAPDGKYAYVTHILARFHMPTTQLERGWMNTNAMSIIDTAGRKLVNTVLLDDVDKGAANPWGVTCTADSKSICVTHAGTQELSVIDAPGLMAKLAKLPEKIDPTKAVNYTAASLSQEDVPNDLSFLVGLRRRIRLAGNGPRSVVVIGTKAYVAEYFTDTLSVVDLTVKARSDVKQVALGPKPKISQVRQGEIFFHDASLCFQTWQSCSSCHPDIRTDGLNWDLLNDGIGNPKSTKSMLLAHKTPPAMVTGVRASAEVAVRAGIHHIQFAVRPEKDAQAIDAFLKSVKPMPSPHLVDGKLSEAARRGEKLFNNAKVGCAACHPAPLYTTLKKYNVGSRGKLSRVDEFDTPTLIECWRTGPYLHDGRAVTLTDMLTKHNPGDKHGATSHLSKQQIADLVEFVLSL